MEAKFDSSNNELKAYRMIERTNNNYFLAGRVGIGKTSFLKKVQQDINKRFILLTPIGQQTNMPEEAWLRPETILIGGAES